MAKDDKDALSIGEIVAQVKRNLVGEKTPDLSNVFIDEVEMAISFRVRRSDSGKLSLEALDGPPAKGEVVHRLVVSYEPAYVADEYDEEEDWYFEDDEDEDKDEEDDEEEDASPVIMAEDEDEEEGDEEEEAPEAMPAEAEAEASMPEESSEEEGMEQPFPEEPAMSVETPEEVHMADNNTEPEKSSEA